ncbi:hypothetical protein MPF_1568 [Methanohalophilus portucalensis FDF-1]|uniref:Uncharacterized protein n=1 Tax=Methanohalophilus portucalensis FDF-1 TaxID=523843 RepID=A0A1L9C3N2_9EURY|nr:hypothetical protein MPF_1568 [Methanohalophilus portucalensis FDF-1]
MRKYQYLASYIFPEKTMLWINDLTCLGIYVAQK